MFYPIFHEIEKYDLIDIYVLYQFYTCILNMHKHSLTGEDEQVFFPIRPQVLN